MMSLVRVLIVDDSVFIREVLGGVPRSELAIEVVGTAASGDEALSLVPRLRPNLVTLDLALPGMSGLATLTGIRKMSANLPVILFGTLTEPYAGIKLGASVWGPIEYVRKPGRLDSTPDLRRQIHDELVAKIRLLCAPSATPYVRSPAVAAPLGTSGGARVEIVAIGASTGGPEALAELIPKLPADFPAPIVIVQHMPAKFTRYLAERLDSVTPLRVREGRAGERLCPGQVWIAPGDYHMMVARRGSDVVLMTNQNASEQGCRPSVDVLFRSVAQSFAGNALAVVLTGMGMDGTSGAEAILDAGGEVIAQDEETSLIWGMPGRVVAAGLARSVCPLSGVPFAIMSRVYASRHNAQAVVAR